MLDIVGPSLVNLDDVFTLICKYNLQDDLVYSVKWFKGDQEIYRYIPGGSPETQTFKIPGVIVDVGKIGKAIKGVV